MISTWLLTRRRIFDKVYVFVHGKGIQKMRRKIISIGEFALSNMAIFALQERKGTDFIHIPSLAMDDPDLIEVVEQLHDRAGRNCELLIVDL